jgi:hypothetical protein
VREVVSSRCVVGGDVGESALGRGPGLQNGMCLFGIAAGVPRCEVLMLRCGGGVAVRSMLTGAAHNTVALMAHIGRNDARYLFLFECLGRSGGNNGVIGRRESNSRLE